MAVADDDNDYPVEVELIGEEEASSRSVYEGITREAGIETVSKEDTVSEEAFVAQEELFIVEVTEKTDDSNTPSSMIICSGT